MSKLKNFYQSCKFLNLKINLPSKMDKAVAGIYGRNISGYY